MIKKFILPFNRGEVILSTEVIEHLYKYSQDSRLKLEAGGQIFSKNPDEKNIIVSKATGPYQQDFRQRFSFKMNSKKASSDRFDLFKKGLYVVGIWHTHPENLPVHSTQDRETTMEHLISLQGDMDGFLSLIVGNKGSFPNVAVWSAWTDNPVDWVQLKEKYN